jgi:hypothetical protein
MNDAQRRISELSAEFATTIPFHRLRDLAAILSISIQLSINRSDPLWKTVMDVGASFSVTQDEAQCVITITPQKLLAILKDVMVNETS